MKVLMLTRYDRLGASSRLRSMQYLPCLNAAGFEVTVSPLFTDAYVKGLRQNQRSLGEVVRCYARRLKGLLHARSFDLVWIEKEALPWLPAIFESVFLRGVPYVLDYDDAIFHKYDLNRHGLIRFALGEKLDRLMAGAKLVVAGNQYLAKRAKCAGARWVEIVPTVVDIDRYEVKEVAGWTKDGLKIVWIGSPSTAQYLDILAEPLRNLASHRRFTLRVIGAAGVDIAGVDTEFIPWSEDVEVAAIRECDIGVMPLFDLPFERGKCGYKLIQYMACGLPVVASPIGVNVEIVKVGEVGFLAESASEWEEAIGRLLDDAALRDHFGSAGRLLAERDYSLQGVAPRLSNLLKTAAVPC